MVIYYRSIPVLVLKAEHYSKMFSARIKGRAQCYASSHSDFHEHLWSHDAGKECHWEGYITQTTNI